MKMCKIHEHGGFLQSHVTYSIIIIGAWITHDCTIRVVVIIDLRQNK